MSSVNPVALHMQPVVSASTQTLADAPAPEDVTAWLRYDRPAEYEAIATKIRVPLRDGVELVGTLLRPGQGDRPVPGRFPGVLQQFTPYDMTLAMAPFEYLAERGYVVLCVNVRGSGESEGEFDAWFPESEPQDNFDVIEWLAAQDYSDGHVGQVGVSYGSIAAYRVAALRPPHLDTIVPMASTTDIYAEWVRPGGVPTTAGAWWATAPTLTKQGHAKVLKAFEDHPLDDAFWRQVATTNKIVAAEVPALHIGGYYDIFKNGGFDALRQRPEKTWLLYGPWMHLLPLTVPGRFSSGDLNRPLSISYSVVLQWLDRWLTDRPGATLPPSRVISFEDRADGTVGAWGRFDEWPPARTAITRLHPTASGRLETIPPAGGQSEYSVNPYDGPSACAIGCLPGDAHQNQAMSEMDARNAEGRYAFGRTTFTTAPFATDTVVAGPVAFTLQAALTAQDTYFVSKLELVTAEGEVLPLETGHLRARTRNDLAAIEDITPGEVNEYTIFLGQIHYRFVAGQALRVTISGGDVPFVVPDSPSGLVTVNHGEGTYLDVPLLHAGRLGHTVYSSGELM